MIDEVLGTPLRVKIIITLWKLGEVSVTELAREILRTNFKQVNTHIQFLSSRGIVEERKVGRLRLVKLREEKPIVELAKILAELDEYMKLKIESQMT